MTVLEEQQRCCGGLLLRFPPESRQLPQIIKLHETEWSHLPPPQLRYRNRLL